MVNIQTPAMGRNARPHVPTGPLLPDPPLLIQKRERAIGLNPADEVHALSSNGQAFAHGAPLPSG